MDEERLTVWVSEGLSLEQMGRLAGRHPSTVSYWLAKHGLSAPGREKHAPRGPIDRTELAALVDSGASIAEIAETLRRGTNSVRHWLGRYELETLATTRRRTARNSMASTMPMVCRIHGPTDFRRDSRGYFKCLRCRSEAVTRRRRKVKETLIAEAGGACAICGYDRFPGALQFHHREPALKRFALSADGFARSIVRARAEAAKCILLCSNCHAEVEGGSVTLSGERGPPG
jgi:DNA-binding CsgD family transcriptional regulator